MKCSIVLLTYNGEKYLMQQLKSIKNQTYRPIKLIVSDDASTDKTVEIAKQFADLNQEDEFEVEVVANLQNKGRAGNRNSIIDRIEGEFVFLADQDDIWDKDKVKKQIDFLKKYPECFAVSCDRRLVDRNGKQLLSSENRYAPIESRHKKIIGFKENLKFKASYPANCIAFRNRELEKVFTIPENMQEPDRFLRMMCLCMGKIGYVDAALVSYRIHAENLSGNYFAQSNRNLYKILKCYIKSNKRYNAMFEKDDELIFKEAIRRFGVDLAKGPKYLRRNAKRAYIDALLAVYRDIMEQRVGAFIKNK